MFFLGHGVILQNKFHAEILTSNNYFLSDENVT